MKRSLPFMLLVLGCGNGAVSPATVTSACATASACLGFGNDLSACSETAVYVNDPALAASFNITKSMVSCLASAGHDCAAAKRCLANGSTPAPCSGNGASCDGAKFLHCTAAAGTGGNNGMQIFDCNSIGQTCVAANGSVGCGLGSCSGVGATCVAADGSPNGNFLQTCDNGIVHRFDCGHIGSTCNPSGFAGAHCRGLGQPCSSATTLRCEGSVLVTCQDGQEGRYDCGKIALGCFPRPSASGSFGCALGTECSSNNYQITCNGTALTFCDNGKVETFDCAKAGFSACDANNGGACR